MTKEKDIVAEIDARIEYLYDHSQCGRPDHILLTKARDEIERLRAALKHAWEAGIAKIGKRT